MTPAEATNSSGLTTGADPAVGIFGRVVLEGTKEREAASHETFELRLQELAETKMRKDQMMDLRFSRCRCCLPRQFAL